MPLSYTQRPESLKERIIDAFNVIRSSPKALRHFKSEESCKIAALDIFQLLKHQIDTIPSQKIFNILDIGTGKGRDLKNLANQINSDESIPPEIRINIIATRPEANLFHNPPEEIIGRCHIYNYNGFNAEFLIEELIAREQGDKKFDIVMSLGFMKYLIDPIGTFEQVYTITRDNTGLLLMDGFWFQIEGQPHFNEGHTPQEQMISLELCTKESGATFLYYPHTYDARSLPEVIIKKGHTPLQLPFQYTENIIPAPQGVVPEKISVYKPTDLKHPKLVTDPACKSLPQATLATLQLKDLHALPLSMLIGDKALYEEIEDCLCYTRPSLPLPHLPNHAAYIGDFEVVEKPLVGVTHTTEV